MAAAEEAAAALLAARAGAMSRENHQPTEPLHPRCSAHWGRAVRAAAAAQPPPGTHSLAQCPGRRRRRGRTRRQRREREKERKRKTEANEGGRSGTGGGRGGEEREGSPALRGRSARQTPKVKLFQFKHLLLNLSSRHDRVPVLRKKGRGDPGRGKPKRMVSVPGGTASFPQTGGCGSDGGLGGLSGPGHSRVWEDEREQTT